MPTAVPAPMAHWLARLCAVNTFAATAGTERGISPHSLFKELHGGGFVRDAFVEFLIANDVLLFLWSGRVS